jgi:hypothetical protein
LNRHSRSHGEVERGIVCTTTMSTSLPALIATDVNRSTIGSDILMSPPSPRGNDPLYTTQQLPELTVDAVEYGLPAQSLDPNSTDMWDIIFGQNTTSASTGPDPLDWLSRVFQPASEPILRDSGSHQIPTLPNSSPSMVGGQAITEIRQMLSEFVCYSPPFHHTRKLIPSSGMRKLQSHDFSRLARCMPSAILDSIHSCISDHAQAYFRCERYCRTTPIEHDRYWLVIPGG